MERQRIEGQGKEIQQLAIELQQQGERCARAGLLEQATAILAQVWSITQECDPDRANAAAWEAGWLRLQMRLYGEAASWFSHVGDLPAGGSPLWSAARQTLVQLCLELANGATDPARTVAPAPAQAASSLHPMPPSALPKLRVRNLGRFEIVRDAAVLPICTAYKAITLFRYLLGRRRQAARKEELLELLWPDARPQAATHSLHVAISTLRRYLDPPNGSYLLFEAGHYSICPEAPVNDDCDYFEQRLDAAERYRQIHDLVQAQQAYTDAITCYQGDYFVVDQDFAWAIAEQERLLARYLSALDHLGQVLIARRYFESAVEYYQRLLERDSYREDAHCQVMRCYWLLGRRYEALRQYRRCASILMNDLGLEPMPQTQALYQTISAHNVPTEALVG